MDAMIQQLERIMPTGLTGSVMNTVGMTAAVAGFPAPVGALVEIDRTTDVPLRAEVIGFRDDLTLIYPLRPMTGVRRGNPVRLIRTARWLRVGDGLLGRVVDAGGRPSTADRSRHSPSERRSTATHRRRHSVLASIRRSELAFGRSMVCSHAAKASGWASSPVPA